MRMPSTELVSFVQEKRLPWLSFNEDEGRLEFIIDNYLLSMYRSCPSHFMLKAVDGWHSKGQRSWSLDFGTLFHKLMEEYYQNYKKTDFSLEDFAIKTALFHWKEMKMDEHLSHPQCQSMGGYPGFAGMLAQYANQFKSENETLKVLASEVSFGKNKEVPIFTQEKDTDFGIWSCANIFLSGRIDIVADDGHYILPVDHKTMSSFRKDPANWYSVDDGPNGYIYALKHLLPLMGFPEELILKRSCSRILMNFISKEIPKKESRFKRIALLRGEEALENYRVRVIGTCNNLLNDLELYVRGLSVPRDTSKCGNWYFTDCDFIDVHRQQSKDAELATLGNAFVRLPIWNTEAVKPLYEGEGS